MSETVLSNHKEAEAFARAYAEWFAARARQEELNADNEDPESAEKDRECPPRRCPSFLGAKE
jgi:hypothetical protein